MIRIVKLSGVYYGCDMSNLTPLEIIEEISAFTETGDPVLLVEDIENIKWFNEDLENVDIIMVERENE